MEGHRTGLGDAAATGPGLGESRKEGAILLPLAARRVLWQRVWDRLLTPPPDDPRAPTRSDGPNSGAQASEEDAR